MLSSSTMLLPSLKESELSNDNVVDMPEAVGPDEKVFAPEFTACPIMSIGMLTRTTEDNGDEAMTGFVPCIGLQCELFKTETATVDGKKVTVGHCQMWWVSEWTKQQAGSLENVLDRRIVGPASPTFRS